MIRKTGAFEKDGKINEVYTFTNKNGATMQMITYGARITSLCVPDKNGNFSDVIVGCKNLCDYYDQKDYFGATIGRYCNRIEKGKFTLNGRQYQLETNQNSHSLHGGKTANFDRQIWSAEIKGDSLVFSLFSPDGAGGYPGNMQVKAIYTLTDDNQVVCEFIAKSDKDTICNMTQHSFFNIGDDHDILEQELMINASYITPCDKELIPHGDFLAVKDTPFDFTSPKAIKTHIHTPYKTAKTERGYDCNFCIDRKTERELEHCATLFDKKSGRKLDCYTTLPGLQIYTTNYDGAFTFEGKKKYGLHSAICLETQFYPNSPNCKEYPSTVLKRGEDFRHKTVYAFSVE